MSPEHILGREVDHRSDLFSVGVILVEALTGRKPFINDEKPYPASLYETYELPFSSPEGETLKEIVRRCLSKEPQQRPPSAAALQAELVPALRACACL
jgi:serine/threonine protein kinase